MCIPVPWPNVMKRRYYCPPAMLTMIVFATEGTPAESMAKSIQYPGIRIPGSAGSFMVYVLPLAVAVRGTRRWSVLTVWVEVPDRIRDHLDTARLVVAVKVLPGSRLEALTLLIIGREAF